MAKKPSASMQKKIAADAKMDKKRGIKEGSAADKRMDKKKGIPY